MDEELMGLLQELFGSDLLEELEIVKLDETELIIKDNAIEQTIVFNWKGIFSMPYDVWLSENKDHPHLNYRIESLVGSYAYDKFNHNMLNYMDRGFYKSGYAEFFIHYNMFDLEYDLWKFNIGAVSVQIGEPSSLFKMLNYSISTDDLFADWSAYYTISLFNVTKENFQDVLHQALFYIQKCKPSYYINDIPEIYKYMYEGDGGVDLEVADLVNTDFKLAKYSEPISFFTAGDRNRDQISFLYYYKVLEFFFIINRKQELEQLITKYSGNLDKLILEVTRVYKTREIDLLGYLLNNLSFELVEILETVYKDELIKEKTIKALSDEIYKIRNSIVHGKSDSGFELLLPKLFEDEENDIWRTAIRKIASICIDKYCFK
ncbi:hypothetical protein Q0V21_04950 [Paenibacillus sp. 11B]|uniref:hypothetical protein n=1 Tax=Paenibacillus sp. 11B TaxID=3060965 RepID=UPI002656ED87|nr:hypothetical protein [Paenibacillus sp. 11B]MDN8588115.1 hypothetical protein [Paenibacillus sp. 11B]